MAAPGGDTAQPQGITFFILVFSAMTGATACEVVWRRGKKLGLRFIG